MYVLGVIGYPGSAGHDGSAAILKDGVVLAAAEQERFSHRKHAPGEAPYDAIQFCLKKAGLKLDEVDYIANAWSENKHFEIFSKGTDTIYSRTVFPKSLFNYKNIPPIVFVKHHVAHIMSSYFQSGFSDSAALVIDAQGENESITLASMDKDKLKIFRQYDITCSLGAFYDSASNFCGLGFNDAGKLMGLAPYGVANQKMPLEFDFKHQKFEHLFKIPNRKNISLSEMLNLYTEYFTKFIFPFKVGDKSDIMTYVNFAASAQKTVEDIILNLCKILKTKTHSDNLTISGGVGLNCTANGLVDRSGTFKNIFIHPGSNDAGASIGAALEVFRHFGLFKSVVPQRINHVYYGADYSNEDIKNVVKNTNLKVQKSNFNSLTGKVASMLQKGKIIAWFQNGFEFGPRALGARSFLASPEKRDTLNKLNNLKGREIWRPLSPMVLEEYYGEIFTDKNPQNLSQFMLKTCFINNKWQAKIPAVVHIDGTSRPQIITAKTNSVLHNIMSKYYKLSGIPVIINTSLNLKNQPIVNTPREVLAIYENNPLIDVLIIGNWIVTRNN